MLTVFVAAAPAAPGSARAAAVAIALISLRIVRLPFGSSGGPLLLRRTGTPSRRTRSVLLTPSMSLQTDHKRALVAGGTGRLGRAVAARLIGDGWDVVAEGRRAGDLASAIGARTL